MATMKYSDAALYRLFKCTFNKETAVSIQYMKDKKIKVTVRSLRKDCLNVEVMDSLIQAGPLYSDYLC